MNATRTEDPSPYIQGGAWTLISTDDLADVLKAGQQTIGAPLPVNGTHLYPDCPDCSGDE